MHINLCNSEHFGGRGKHYRGRDLVSSKPTAQCALLSRRGENERGMAPSVGARLPFLLASRWSCNQFNALTLWCRAVNQGCRHGAGTAAEVNHAHTLNAQAASVIVSALPFLRLRCWSRILGSGWSRNLCFWWLRNFRLRSLWCWCAWFVSHNQPLYHAAGSHFVEYCDYRVTHSCVIRV